MRNIAVLEWGPPTLYHMLPREKVRVRTAWLDGGPSLPAFLSRVTETSDSPPEAVVRYALSAFEDLNAVIRNLRKCFGFPHQESIGYLNTLTRSHRARTEHEWLIDRLRRWAQHSNVDAIVWIDYAKQNMPPGSFKVGPRASLPFSRHHINFCSKDAAAAEHDADEETDLWSEVDDLLPKTGMFSLRRASAEVVGHKRNTQDLSNTGASHPLGLPVLSGRPAGANLSRLVFNSTVSVPKAHEASACRIASEEDAPPAYGSIYPRSLGPGPGNYEPGEHASGQPRAPAFTSRDRGWLGEIVARSSQVPGPADYTPVKPLVVDPKTLGSFQRAPKLAATPAASKKLASACRQTSPSQHHVASSPSELVPPDTSRILTAVISPNYSFARSRRLF